MSTWISVKTKKPNCARDPNALGVPVLIWPRNPTNDRDAGVDGFCYFGRRANGKPAFYLYGRVLEGVTHWMPLPEPPHAD